MRGRGRRSHQNSTSNVSASRQVTGPITWSPQSVQPPSVADPIQTLGAALRAGLSAAPDDIDIIIAMSAREGEACELVA